MNFVVKIGRFHGTTLSGVCFWIKHMNLSKRKLKHLHLARILIEQITEIGGWEMSC